MGIEGNSIDVIVSNCVINLVPDKEAVIREVARTLKPGGELYFSDVYSDKVVSESARKNEMLWGECISGKLLNTNKTTILFAKLSIYTFDVYDEYV